MWAGGETADCGVMLTAAAAAVTFEEVLDGVPTSVLIIIGPRP